MSSLGERKCALLLVTLRKSDRRKLLAGLPAPVAASIRRLVEELERLPVPAAELSQSVLGEEVRGLTAQTSLDLEQLVALSRRLQAPWFARVLTVWTGVDREFCLAMLDKADADAVRAEIGRMPALPTRLVEAIKAEAARAARIQEAA